MKEILVRAGFKKIKRNRDDGTWSGTYGTKRYDGMYVSNVGENMMRTVEEVNASMSFNVTLNFQENDK